MIKLEVEDYCQNCPEFEADVNKSHMIAIGRGLNEELTNETVVRCKHAIRCKMIMNTVISTLRRQSNGMR